MVIYIEIILIVDLIINLLSLLIIKEVLYLNIGKFFYFSLIIDLIYMIFYIYGTNISYFKYFMPIIFVILSFKLNIIMFFKALTLYYLLNYFLGGIAFNIKLIGNIKYVVMMIIYAIFIGLFYLIYKRKDIFITYNIEFTLNEKKHSYNAFFDTGCNLLYKGYPVFIINTRYKPNYISKDKYNFYTATNSNDVDIYEIEKLKLNNRIIKCYCIFLDVDYDAIIGINFL